ncbi:ABC transporter substrate-binding protein [Actinokineospora guangxiensis]|uniref:ABC transporter substrate-binding protein n=1 Tax=Actinokineospora guangxiensis TaxID=1490288 RepID=A0ABW0ETL9_9PSEU
MRMTAPLAAVAATLLLAGCAPEAAPPVTTPTCSKDTLQTMTAGKFTFATDEPVYQPWYLDNDPSNGKGFESAVAYAVAEYLGYARTDVVWNRVPFNAAIQPGKKNFDANLTEFSITEERRQAVDFSAPYYEVAQAVVTVGSSPAVDVKSVAELRKVKLGAQVGTTSYEAAVGIAPEEEVAVYNTNDEAKAALTAGQIDALVLDLPTAFYVTSAELTDGSIVGQLARGRGRPEQFGIVLDKGSPLTQCVSSAVEALRANGILQKLEQEWLASPSTAPQLR